MVRPPPKKYEPAASEKDVLEFWKRADVFRRSIEERSVTNPFVFLEGPPTANGLPHAGHVLTRTLKDTVCRYQTMLGHRVDRKAGWDCHGLPVEIEVQKAEGLKDVQDIEAYGIEAFNKKCRESVFKYKGVWEGMSERVGFWLDFDDPYVTMDDAYIESVWWSLKQLHDKGMLFKDYKVVPYCPQTGTSYSSHEVAQGYKTVTDLSVYVKFKLVDDDDACVLSWTTTPWTLPGNVALAVGDDVTYVKVRVTERGESGFAEPGEVLVLAKALLKATMRNEYETIVELPGSELVGKRYEPLFPGAVDPSGSKTAHTIVAADFVTTEDGTGVVHTAVMYGDDDFDLGEQIGLPKQHTVDLRGRFVSSVGDGLAGRYVKECDEDIASMLKERGLLYREQAYEHQYPHCWRTGHPLLYYAMESWFIKMSGLRDDLLAANEEVGWFPDNIKEGRFGEWLRNVKDWAISRKRFWGTPIPVWTCHGTGDGPREGCGHEVCIGSTEELAELVGQAAVPDDLHRPFIDIEVSCPACRADGREGTLRREPYVLDCWYDSGAAHFAQWQHPKGSTERNEHFPIDFIAEGLDQTRGWFYSLMATGVSVFRARTYNNVLVNGLILAEDGQKMSKSKRNYTDPDELFEKFGADAVRWNLLTSSAPWMDKRFYEATVRESLSKYVLTLWNSYSFFATYAAMDGWSAADLADAQAPNDRPPIDQWLLDAARRAIGTTQDQMSRYALHKATRALEDFVVDDLSNWYVRRVRKRLWQESDDPDKRACYATLHEVLTLLAGSSAPFAPFIAETLYQALKGGEEATPIGWKDSVHLTDFPAPMFEASADLVASMATVRGLVEAGRALRAKVGINNRHPLASATLVPTSEAEVTPDRLSDLLDVFAEEMNVKDVRTAADMDRFTEYTVEGDPGRIGPRFKQKAREVNAAIAALDPAVFGAKIEAGENVHVHLEGEEIELHPEDFRVQKVERSGFASTKADGYVLVLDTERTPELVAEGLARELVRRIQDMRKGADLDVEDRIDVSVVFTSDVDVPVSDFESTIKHDVRCEQLVWDGPLDASDAEQDWQIDDRSVSVQIKRVAASDDSTAPKRSEPVAS